MMQFRRPRATALLLLALAAAPLALGDSQLQASSAPGALSASAHLDFRIVIPKALYLEAPAQGAGPASTAARPGKAPRRTDCSIDPPSAAAPRRFCTVSSP